MRATFCVTLSLALIAIPIITRADDPRSPESERPALVDSVHVQPRGPHFDPLSAEDDYVQKNLKSLNERQQVLEVMFDKKLMICRRC